MSASRPASRATLRPRPAGGRPGARRLALLVIDNAPLQRAAWAELHTARKQHDKAARDLHRHEQVDAPAYAAWLHQSFGVLVTRLRELHAEVERKSQQVQMVQALGSLTGRSLKKIWREQKAYEADPEAYEQRHGPPDDEPPEAGADPEPGEEGPSARRFRYGGGHGFPDDDAPSAPTPPATTREAREIYRRLVQRLHPDRGGEFTPARQKQWHEVQQAWAAGDADWLARLEAEWEAASDVLTPTSPLSRLRRAVVELQAARRDTERKLRDYRGSAAWRFTLATKKRDALHRRTVESLEHDLELLQRHLAHLDATIAAWERPTRSSRRPRSQAWLDDDDRATW